MYQSTTRKSREKDDDVDDDDNDDDEDDSDDLSTWLLTTEATMTKPFAAIVGRRWSSEVKSNLSPTMGQKRRKYRINTHLIIHCPMSKGVSEVSERASE